MLSQSADNTLCIIEHFGNADAVPQPPERCLSRKAELCGVASEILRGKVRVKNRGRAVILWVGRGDLTPAGRVLLIIHLKS